MKSWCGSHSFERWYKQENDSDTKVQIKVDRSSDGRAAKRCKLGCCDDRQIRAEGLDATVVEEFPAHKILLKSHSDIFKATLENWDAVVVLLVSEEEVAAAQELIKYIYTHKIPENLLFVLQLWRIADRYQVLACVNDCKAAIVSTPIDKWDDNFLLPLLHLFEDLPYSAAVEDTLVQKAREKTRTMFEDLEAQFQDPAKRDAFSNLPLSSVVDILEMDRLKVKSENTVATAVHLWMQNQPEAVQAEAAARIVPLIRVAHLTASYLVYIFPNLPWVKMCRSSPEIIATCTRFAILPDYHKDEELDEPNTPRYLLPRVVRSSMTRVEYTWQVKVMDLRDIIQCTKPDGFETNDTIKLEHRICFSGIFLWLLLRCVRDESTDSKVLRVFLEWDIAGVDETDISNAVIGFQGSLHISSDGGQPVELEEPTGQLRAGESWTWNPEVLQYVFKMTPTQWMLARQMNKTISITVAIREVL